MASKRHKCERPGWGGESRSDKTAKRHRETARHVIRKTLMAAHVDDFGKPQIEKRFFRKGARKAIKVWSREAAAIAAERVPEPEAA